MEEKTVHDQMKRVYEVARELKIIAGVNPQTELADALNAASQVVNNWDKRGVPAAVKLHLQTEFNINATWVETGIGSRFIEPAKQMVGDAAPSVDQSTPISDEELLRQMGEWLARVPQDRRMAVADALAGWAKEGGADHWRLMALAAIAPIAPDKEFGT